MKAKLDFLMKNKGLSASSLARKLEIQPSGISHILTGRNKPSFDLVARILRAFPDVNPDWLLLDADEPFRIGGSASAAPTLEESLDDELQHQSLFDAPSNIPFSESFVEQKNEQRVISSIANNGAKRIERIIVLYSDHSFDCYTDL